MTTVYLIRHCQADYSLADDRARYLTPKGKEDSLLITAFLKDKNISHIYSSPYQRALATICDFARVSGLLICSDEAFREHHSARDRSQSYDAYSFYQHYWLDHEYQLPGGDSFRAVQERCVSAVKDLLSKHENENIVIVSHGFACGTLLNYYDVTFNFEKWWEFNKLTPAIVEMKFDGQQPISSALCNFNEV